jgi:tRNA threonylcarbamoyladenosine biosynthesis protein TsaB
MPIILAIETSSELASCALLSANTLITRASSGVRTHSQSILPMVQEVLAEAGITLKDCAAIAFGAGPGSFTGVRTACGIAQGLAFGAGLPAVPVVTLAAMALACRQQTGAADVLAVLDARMGEVYWAQYSFGQDDVLREVSAPALCAPGEVAPLPTTATTPLAACGNGFSAYAEAFAGRDFADGALAGVMPHARQVAQLARVELALGHGVKPAEAQPLYLRNKIAFTSAERQVINAAKAAA